MKLTALGFVMLCCTSVFMSCNATPSTSELPQQSYCHARSQLLAPAPDEFGLLRNRTFEENMANSGVTILEQLLESEASELLQFILNAHGLKMDTAFKFTWVPIEYTSILTLALRTPDTLDCTELLDEIVVQTVARFNEVYVQHQNTVLSKEFNEVSSQLALLDEQLKQLEEDSTATNEHNNADTFTSLNKQYLALLENKAQLEIALANRFTQNLNVIERSRRY